MSLSCHSTRFFVHFLSLDKKRTKEASKEGCPLFELPLLRVGGIADAGRLCRLKLPPAGHKYTPQATKKLKSEVWIITGYLLKIFAFLRIILLCSHYLIPPHENTFFKFLYVRTAPLFQSACTSITGKQITLCSVLAQGGVQRGGTPLCSLLSSISCRVARNRQKTHGKERTKSLIKRQESDRKSLSSDNYTKNYRPTKK